MFVCSMSARTSGRAVRILPRRFARAFAAASPDDAAVRSLRRSRDGRNALLGLERLRKERTDVRRWTCVLKNRVAQPGQRSRRALDSVGASFEAFLTRQTRALGVGDYYAAMPGSDSGGAHGKGAGNGAVFFDGESMLSGPHLRGESSDRLGQLRREMLEGADAAASAPRRESRRGTARRAAARARTAAPAETGWRR